MHYNKYLGIIGGAGAITWIGWTLVVTQLSPYKNMPISLILFFLTLFIALTCTFTVIGFYFRIWLLKNEIFYQHINISLRQGFFLSLIAILCLIFQIMKVLTWWSGLLVITSAILLEFYFSAKDSETMS